VADVRGLGAVEQLADTGHLDVPSGLWPDRGYRLRPWRRVAVLRRREDGGWDELQRSWCVHPEELYPSGDEIVALWLALRYDEAATIATANLHREAA